MIVKVCGIRDQENHDALTDLNVDMIGINFYPQSSRYIGNHFLEIKKDQLRTGVFVNAKIDEIVSATSKHQLDFAQLHGDEDQDYCNKVKDVLSIIKVFRISDHFNWSVLNDFSEVDYFLFDTMTKKYGGSGKKFDWGQLNNYRLKVPFILSGGIGPDDAEIIKSINHQMLAGVDINSKFEISPAVKNIELIEIFLKEIRD